MAGEGGGAALRAVMARVLADGRGQGVFPSAVAAVAAGDVPPVIEAVGDARPGSRFDVASLTKLFTTTAVGLLWHRGVLSLDEVVHRGATVEDLLRHRSGLPAWRPWFEAVRAEEARDGLPVGLSPAARVAMLARVRAEPPVAAPGEAQVYSDLGFILLGELVAERAGRPLHRFVEEEVCGPLGLADTAYHPFRSHAGDPACLPTEDCPWRGGVLRGEVHDDNAWAMGGVAGHAGIFSTAADLLAFGGAWLRADAGEPGPVPPEVARRFWVPPDPGRTYALGWDTPTPGASSAGRHFSPRSFGHLGFTGTSLWIDVPRRRTVVLLTNRVHPSRGDDRIRAFRPAFHDAVCAVLGAGAGV
ncbi:beta-lactamase family protein [Myxococcota bacterium]|nr:beta-lactamase family protein [Myxococcota bacterium]